ncbi:MAG: gamma-glutamyltransferase [Rhodovibrionaceae bacterium]
MSSGKNGTGAVACGHPATAAAAREILEDGGTAFDAVLAALCAAAVAEPVLSSLGGGGFLLAQTAEGERRLYDFFVDTPREKRRAEEISFYPVLADFGTATQEFHIGLGAAAVPGAVKGLFAIHADLGSLPMARLIAPAARLAREGVELRAGDAFIHKVVEPIATAHDDTKALLCGSDGRLLTQGERLRNPALAEALEALAEEGERLLYAGPWGAALVALSQQEGGQLTQADLAGYRVERRRPLIQRYRTAELATNPPPSTGGLLICFALGLLAERSLAPGDFGSPEHLRLLGEAMELTARARGESGLNEAEGADEAEAAAQWLLDPELRRRYAAEIGARPTTARGTTHISVADGAGNIAAMTLSNGEGCGRTLPGTGIVLNNMLGEEDLNPRGFHTWPPGTRIGSMMAPSLVGLPGGGIAALGSGGSNRIRTAILQVLSNLIDFAMPPEEAIAAPRLHIERGLANAEDGFSESGLAGLQDLGCETLLWPQGNLFFGGVHLVRRGRDGGLSAVGDPRRGGVAEVF